MTSLQNQTQKSNYKFVRQCVRVRRRSRARARPALAVDPALAVPSSARRQFRDVIRMQHYKRKFIMRFIMRYYKRKYGYVHHIMLIAYDTTYILLPAAVYMKPKQDYRAFI